MRSPGSTWERIPTSTSHGSNWLPDGKTLAIQRESRDQRRLDLVFADIGTGASRLVLTETSDTWIDLNDELSFLKKSRSSSGHPRVTASRICIFMTTRAISCAGSRPDPGASTTSVPAPSRAIDEKRRLIYFTATEKNPVERQLYRASLDGGDAARPARVSQEDGVHESDHVARRAILPG